MASKFSGGGELGSDSGLRPANLNYSTSRPAGHAKPKVAYLSGVLGAQVANNGLIVTLPLLLLGLGQGVTAIGLVTAWTTVLDMAGTLLGAKLNPRVALVGATVVRAAAVAAAVLSPTVPLLVAFLSIDALARGVADTARNTAPLLIAGKDQGARDKLNASSQTVFELGAVVGPLTVGALIVTASTSTAAWFVPVAFAVAALLYTGVPKGQAQAKRKEGQPSPLKNPWVKTGLAASALLTLYPLKAVLPAVFAVSVLGDASQAAWLVAAFGIGGTAGSIASHRLAGKLKPSGWLALAAGGATLLGLAWLPGSFWTMAAAGLLFSASNVMARLSVTGLLQARVDGAAVGAQRFLANAVSVLVRAAFAVPGLGLAVVATAAGGQLWMSRKLANLPHNLPGRLIVAEGLDGSGKSTQLDMLRAELERQGLDVVLTTWNSSKLVSKAVKKGKKNRAMTPETFSLLHAADLAERLNKEVLPALREGKVVLADRWFFTALARDNSRGMEAKWLRKLYAFAPQPDLTLYFTLPVETAIGRVLSRGEGKPRLSEDRGETAKVKYYEGGLDVGLSEDPLENFHLFQRQVTARYDAQAREFGFKVIDATQERPIQHAQVKALVGDLSSFKDKKPEQSNIFDKDPKDDPENIRKNYRHEERGAHFYFRNMKLKMQERFTQLMDMSTMPRVFLHGSPHVDNYSKSEVGAAMVDFDRSRFGPYAWDIVRVLTSISYRQKNPSARFLPKDTAAEFLRGYLRGFRKPHKAYRQMEKLRHLDPGPEDVIQKKWLEELRSMPIPLDDPDMLAVFRSYLDSRGEEGMPRILEAGKGKGSMGRDRYLILLADDVLIEIKRVREDQDDEQYKNPFDHHGKRMITAAELYAPGWERRQGWATHKDLQYWGHQVPGQNVKLKKRLNSEDQEDFAYAVGTQLGRAHRLSLQAPWSPEQLEAHLEKNYKDIMDAGAVMKAEITAAYKRYMHELGKQRNGSNDRRCQTGAVAISAAQDTCQQPTSSVHHPAWETCRFTHRAREEP